MDLAKLKKVDLRRAWKHEAQDFTQWLATEENLELLGNEIGLDIVLIQTEADVGRFNVDILAEDEITKQRIIIENQLETTNHDHLGKIITYASGYDANVVIWIVEDVRDEHKQAIDWLNENTGEDINFFIIQMELWQIDSSPLAPKFYVVSKPNDWAKAVKRSAESAALTVGKELQLRFWNGFREYARTRTRLKLRVPMPQHWYDISLGSAEAHIALTVNLRTDNLGCEIYISDSKDLFRKLKEQATQIEGALGEKVEWMELPQRKASRIKLSQEADFGNENSWEQSFQWLLDKSQLFYSVFSRRIRHSRR